WPNSWRRRLLFTSRTAFALDLLAQLPQPGGVERGKSTFAQIAESLVEHAVNFFASRLKLAGHLTLLFSITLNEDAKEIVSGIEPFTADYFFDLPFHIGTEYNAHRRLCGRVLSVLLVVSSPLARLSTLTEMPP